MKKFLTLILLAFFAFSAKAQTKAQADSLVVVKNYVQKLHATVNNTKLSGKDKAEALTTLISQGTKIEKTLKNNLPAFATGNNAKSLYSSYRLIVQSAILYKTDLKGNNYKEEEGAKGEKKYLGQNVPVFTQQLDAYINSSKKQ